MRLLYPLLLVGALAAGGLPAALPAQASATRFHILDVGDSTVTFDLARERWVRSGQRGIAVDPTRRDALVARLLVTGVEPGLATALVTGQTTRLNGTHVVLLQRPPTPFYRQRSFWVGAILGAVAGAVAVSR